MTRHQPRNRLSTRHARRKQSAKPRRVLRLAPLATIAAVLMLAAPATAQLSGLGQVTGTVESSVNVPEIPQPQLSTSLSHQVSISAPEIELEGHVYQVLSAAEMAAAQAQGATYLCGQLSSQVEAPAGLSSHADVCSHLDAQALFYNASGMILAVKTQADQWITMPDLHKQVSVDIQADVDTHFAYEAAGWLKSKAESTGTAIVAGAQGTANGIAGGFKAGISFFGKLF